jgi:hypothetical protein
MEEILMQTPRFFRQTIFLIFLLALSACSMPGQSQEPTPTEVDTFAIFTAAAQTVAASFTQTVAAYTPTPLPTDTPPPTATLAAFPTAPGLGTPLTFPTAALGTPGTTPLAPLATQAATLCDNFTFIADITIPDGTIVKPGADFQKIWRIKNTGTCTWDEGYKLVYAYGDDRLDGPGYEIKKKNDFVDPGETADVGMLMTAPLKEGNYTSCWQMVNDRGAVFGPYAICVIIKVKK